MYRGVEFSEDQNTISFRPEGSTQQFDTAKTETVEKSQLGDDFAKWRAGAADAGSESVSHGISFNNNVT